MGEWLDNDWCWVFDWKEVLSSELNSQSDELLNLLCNFAPNPDVSDRFEWRLEHDKSFFVRSMNGAVNLARTVDQVGILSVGVISALKIVWLVKVP